MVTKDYIKGLLYGVGSLILIGIQPIIINSRPAEIDIYLFAMMTVIYEAIIFLPLMLIERKRIKSMKNTNTDMLNEISSLLNGWEKK